MTAREWFRNSHIKHAEACWRPPRDGGPRAATKRLRVDSGIGAWSANGASPGHANAAVEQEQCCSQTCCSGAASVGAAAPEIYPPDAAGVEPPQPVAPRMPTSPSDNRGEAWGCGSQRRSRPLPKLDGRRAGLPRVPETRVAPRDAPRLRWSRSSCAHTLWSWRCAERVVASFGAARSNGGFVVRSSWTLLQESAIRAERPLRLLPIAARTKSRSPCSCTEPCCNAAQCRRTGAMTTPRSALSSSEGI